MFKFLCRCLGHHPDSFERLEWVKGGLVFFNTSQMDFLQSGPRTQCAYVGGHAHFKSFESIIFG